MMLSFLFVKIGGEKKKVSQWFVFPDLTQWVLMLENANQMVRFAQRGQYHDVNLKNKIKLSVELC